MYYISLIDGTRVRLGILSVNPIEPEAKIILQEGEKFSIIKGSNFMLNIKYPGWDYEDGKKIRKWDRTYIRMYTYEDQDFYRASLTAYGFIGTTSTQLAFTTGYGFKEGESVIYMLLLNLTGENIELWLYQKYSSGEEIYYNMGWADAYFDISLDPGATNNPYAPGEPSGPSDTPPGTFEDPSDGIPDSPLPTFSAANTGLTRIYNPTLSQIQALAQYLWTDESVIQTIWNHIKQFFENPMEAMIGLNLVPVPVPNGGAADFAIMYIKTGVTMNTAATQFVDQDCGSCTVERYYGSALDQSPYTKVTCFLPFIGTVHLDTDEVMGHTLNVKYRVDIVSGSCVAKILVDGSVMYQYSGHCAINVPLSAADFSSYVSAVISVAKLAIGAAAGGAMGALAAGTSDATQQTNQVVTRTTTTTETARNPSTGRQITTGTRSVVETTERPSDTSSTQASFEGLSPSNIANTVGQVMSSKPTIEHSGSFSGNSGYLGVRRPYLIIERPNMCLPSTYGELNGYPCMMSLNLGNVRGYTRVQQVQLTGMSATNPEQAEILSLLKSGVIF